MFLYIFGFLFDTTDDDSLKFQMKIDPSFNEEIIKRLGHKSLNAMAEGDWPLTDEEVKTVSSIMKQPLPADLKLLIGVVA